VAPRTAQPTVACRPSGEGRDFWHVDADEKRATRERGFGGVPAQREQILKQVTFSNDGGGHAVLRPLPCVGDVSVAYTRLA